MTENKDLKEALRALAEATPKDGSWQAEQQLLFRFRQRQISKRRRTYLAWVMASAAMAAGLYLAPWHTRHATQRPPVQAEPAFGFIALPYAQSGVPMEQPVIVRMDIPVSELGVSELGMVSVPFTPNNPKPRVKADLLVGQDGIARAVRFVQ